MNEPVVPAEIVDHYEQKYDESTRITAGFGRLEFTRTREIIGRVLPDGPLRILDVGGGPGVHARWLAEAGHHVHVVDPTPRHVAASAALATEGLDVTAELGDTRTLTQADATYDVVLLLGPLYHLVERRDRVQAWREAARVATPDGLVIAAVITRFASLFGGLVDGVLTDPQFRAIVDGDLRDGQHRNPDGGPQWFTTAYFHHPDELEAEAADAALTVTEIVGVEGLACWLPHVRERWDEPTQRAVMLDAARVVESEPSLRSLSPHLLVIARRAAS